MGRRRFRSARSALVAAFAVAALGLSSFGATPPARAESTISVRAYPSSSCVITPAQACPLVISVTNPGTEVVADVSVRILVSSELMTTTTDLASWFGNDSSVETGPLIEFISLGDLEPVTTATVTPDIVLSHSVAGDSWGVMGIDVEADSFDIIAATTRTSVIWAPTSAPHIAPFATIVPLVAPPTLSPYLTSSELSSLTKPGGYLDTQLSVATTASAVAVDPRLVASIYRRGDAAPSSALDWLSNLNAVRGDSFWLSYADADFALAGQVGFTTGLELEVDDALGTNADTSGTRWSPTVSSALWAEPQTLTMSSLSAILTPAPYPMLIAGSGNIPANTTPHALVGVSAPGSPSLDTIVLDDNFTRAIRAAETAETDEEWAVATSEAGAYLAVVASTGSGQINGGYSRNLMGTRQYRTAQTQSYLASLPWAQQAPLMASREYPAVAVALVETPESNERVAGGTVARAHFAELEAFAGAASDPARPIVDATRLVAPALSVAWTNPAADWTEALARLGVDTDDYITTVHFGETSNINMVGGQASIPITVVNGQPFDVNVVVHAVPSNPRLTVGVDQHVTIPAESQGTVKIPVAARVGNGDVDLVLSLSTEAGQPFGETVRVPVSVRADWEGFGLAIMGVLFVGLVATGVVRTLRRRSASSAADGEDA